MSAPRILSCGEVLWDLFPDGERFGGAPANFACHSAVLGGAVSMLSAVGCEARGDAALSIMRGLGVDTSLVQRSATAPTGSVAVAVDAAGKPSFVIHADAAWDRVEWTSDLERRITEFDVIYFGTLGQREEGSRATIRRALHRARARHVLRVLDVNLRRPFYDAALIRESIELANVLKLSDEELPEVAAACGLSPNTSHETTLRALRAQEGLDVVVMTRGAEGALLVSADCVVEQPAIPTRVVDTVGAGDSFTAALVLGMLRGDAWREVLRKACEVASAVCAQPGAVPALIQPQHPSLSA
jgi:fructokinase